MLKFSTREFSLNKEAGAFYQEASQLRMAPGQLEGRIGLVSQVTGQLLEFELDSADLTRQQRERGEVSVFKYNNVANKLSITIFND